jgi:hypothetical protein
MVKDSAVFFRGRSAQPATERHYTFPAAKEKTPGAPIF